MAVPSDFDIASVIWSNLVVASTAFVVLHIAAFVFLAGSATRAIAIGIRTRFGREWEQQFAEKLAEKLAEKVGDHDKRKTILREILEEVRNTVAASLAWRYASLNAVVVLNLYSLGILAGVLGFGLDNSLFLSISILALVVSLGLSTGFISWIFLSLFRDLKIKKS